MTTTPPLFGAEQTDRTRDDYYTPAWVFDELGLSFDLDVAAPPGGPAHVPCDRWFTKADDGLSQPWTGRVWMNPPFSRVGIWTERFVEHGNGVALVQASRARWFNATWDNPTVAWAALPRAMEFEGGAGHIPFTVFLLAMGAANIAALRRSDHWSVR